MHCMGSAGPRCHCALHTASTAALPPRTAQSPAAHRETMMVHRTIRSRARTPVRPGEPARTLSPHGTHVTPRCAAPGSASAVPVPRTQPRTAAPGPAPRPTWTPPGSAPAQFRARPLPPPQWALCVCVYGVGWGGQGPKAAPGPEGPAEPRCPPPQRRQPLARPRLEAAVGQRSGEGPLGGGFGATAGRCGVGAAARRSPEAAILARGRERAKGPDGAVT